MVAEKGPHSPDSSSSTEGSSEASSDYKDSSASVGVKRAQWGNDFQFIFSTVGYAVGLGNIWRFPMQAYENGGGAFLIPYFFCSFALGFPIIYLEMSLGQYTNSGPAVAHGQIRPICQGLGWGMVGITALVAIYFNVILAWDLLYLYMIIIGQSHKWAHCENDWNSDWCISVVYDKIYCKNDTEPFYFNHTCHANKTSFPSSMTMTATEEFFENYILEKSTGIDEIAGLNQKLLICLALAWIITCLALLWGVQVMGTLAYVTGTVPYIIVAILFFNGINLDGAENGIKFYLTEPKMEKVLLPKTWKNAAVQLCYSMAIGFGGFISLSSFNPKKHNCFRDALIVCVADATMSILGGVAVFSILGFMAKKSNKQIEEVVTSGLGLAFIAYPEAISQMPVPWLWSFLFFMMIFLLGISSQFGQAETVCTAIYDQFPHTRPYKWLITTGVCLVLFAIGLLYVTKAGIYYFSILNDYASSFSSMSLALLEVLLICHLYGLRNYIEKDLRTMFGQPRHLLGRILGPTGYYIQTVWCIITPLVLFIIAMLLFKDQIHMELAYGRKESDRYYKFPSWASGIGWFIAFIPIMMLPFPICYDIYKYRKYQRSWRSLFRLHPKWPSYYEQIKIPLYSEAQYLTVTEHSEAETQEDTAEKNNFDKPSTADPIAPEKGLDDGLNKGMKANENGGEEMNKKPSVVKL